MVDFNQLRNNLSTASSTGSFWTSPYPSRQPAQAPTHTAYRPPSSPSEVIPSELSTMSGTTELIYPNERPKYYMRFEISRYERNSLLRVGRLSPEAYIILPLPAQLIDAHHVAYTPKNLGIVGGMVANKANDVIQRLRGAERGSDRISAGNVAAASRDWWRTLGELGTIASSITAPDMTIGTAISAYAGIAPNEFLTIILNGPTYKAFNLTWRLSPKSPQEANTIQKIIRQLNNDMSPGFSSLTSAIFTFPKIFRLALMPNSKYLLKYKPAVLTDLTVNFTPAHQAAFLKPTATTDNLGTPAFVDISMHFAEIELWTSGDFKGTNDPHDVDSPAPPLTIPPPANNPPNPTPVEPGNPGSGFNPGNQIP